MFNDILNDNLKIDYENTKFYHSFLTLLTHSHSFMTQLI